MERPTYLFQVVRLYSLYNVRDIRTVCRDERNEWFVVVVLCPDTVGEWYDYK
jgi:hypothetical protein